MLEEWGQQALTKTSHGLSGEQGQASWCLLGYTEDRDFSLPFQSLR